jgi:hypothetical protein
VQGDAPISWLKVLGFVALLLSGLAGVAWIAAG